MDKPSEQKKDTKAWGDTDIGIHDYCAGGKREQLSGLWGFTTITGGSRDQRLSGCNYNKIHHAKYEAIKNVLPYLLGEAVKKIGTSGPPIENISEPRIVDTFGGFKR